MTMCTNQGKKYEPTSAYPFYCFDIRRQHDVKIGDGRMKTVLYLYCGKKKIASCAVLEDKKTSFEDKVHREAQKLVLSNCKAILECVRNGAYTGLTLDGFFFLVGPRVASQKNWVRNVTIYRNNWRNVLRAQIGDITITDKDLLVKLERVPALSASKKSHKEISEEECQYRRFLGGLLEYAEQTDLIEKGISKQLTKNTKTHESTIALRMLAKQTFSMEELSIFVANCMTWPDAQTSRAILLRVLSGMTIDSVCGLDIEDIKEFIFPSTDLETLTYLKIVKEYKQPRNGEPKMSYLLEDVFSYRYLPCTDVMVQLLIDQVADRKKESPHLCDCAPLFTGTDGMRLTPNAMKNVEEQLIEMSLRSPINLPIGRGSKKGRFRGDFLRANARFHLRYDALLNNQETAAVLGIKPTQVYAASYVDWKYPYILVMLREKMERWHRQYLSVDGSSPLVCYHGVMASGIAQQDTSILIRSAHGIAVTVT